MISFLTLFVLSFAGWTIAVLATKGEHSEVIKAELGNILETVKMFGSSFMNLLRILIKASFSSDSAKEIEEKKDNLVSFVGNEDKNEETKAA